MKNRPRKPHCPRCKHTGFRLSKAVDGRPLFTCDKCGEWWTNGHSGEPYIQHVMEVKGLPKGKETNDIP